MTDNNCNCGCGQTEQMRCINAKSDFDFILRLYDAEHEVIGMPEYDWEAQLYTSSRLNAFIVSSKDGVLTNCWNDNDSIHVVCDNHGLSPGQLFIEFTGYLPNDQYEDGTQKMVLRHSMPIKLMRTNAEPSDTFDMELMFPYIKGDKGDPGQDGKDGQDGKTLTYSDMTEDEKKDLAAKIAAEADGKFQTAAQVETIAKAEVAKIVDGAPESLDTLNEIADTLNKDTEGGVVNSILAEIGKKANSADVYAKGDVDTAISTAKNELNIEIAKKATPADVETAKSEAISAAATAAESLYAKKTDVETALSGMVKIQKLTQEEYDALETKDENVLYAIIEPTTEG